MSRAVTEVKLPSGETAFLLNLNFPEYMAMQFALAKIEKREGASDTDNIVDGYATKLAANVADESGLKRFVDVAAAREFISDVGRSFRDTEALMLAINKNNSFGDEAVEATEKK